MSLVKHRSWCRGMGRSVVFSFSEGDTQLLVLFVCCFGFGFFCLLWNQKTPGFLHSSVFKLKNMLDFSFHSTVCNPLLQELSQTNHVLQIVCSAVSPCSQGFTATGNWFHLCISSLYVKMRSPKEARWLKVNPIGYFYIMLRTRITLRRKTKWQGSWKREERKWKAL